MDNGALQNMQIVSNLFSAPVVKRILYWASSILAIAGIVFVALRIQENSRDIDFSAFTIFTWGGLFFLSVIYGFANIMPALAWRNLLGHFNTKVRGMWAIRIYGITQLARYVPGNIFHIAGRHAWGVMAGIPVKPLTKSIFFELILMSLIGVLFGILVFPLFVSFFSYEFAIILFVCICGLVVTGIWYWSNILIARAAAWHIVFLLLTGVVFAGIFSILVPSDYSLYFMASLSGAYVIAWLAGLLTPGAPAGIGVRELVLLWLLGGVVAEVDLLLAIVLGRIVTMSGDAMFYFVSFIYPKQVL